MTFIYLYWAPIYQENPERIPSTKGKNQNHKISRSFIRKSLLSLHSYCSPCELSSALFLWSALPAYISMQENVVQMTEGKQKEEKVTKLKSNGPLLINNRTEPSPTNHCD